MVVSSDQLGQFFLNSACACGSDLGCCGRAEIRLKPSARTSLPMPRSWSGRRSGARPVNRGAAPQAADQLVELVLVQAPLPAALRSSKPAGPASRSGAPKFSGPGGPCRAARRVLPTGALQHQRDCQEPPRLVRRRRPRLLPHSAAVRSVRTATVIRAPSPSAATDSTAQQIREITNDLATWTLGMRWKIGERSRSRLLPGFLHHFDRDGCVALLAKARGSLSERGRVVVAEYVVNEDRISPPFPAMSSRSSCRPPPRAATRTRLVSSRRWAAPQASPA